MMEENEYKKDEKYRISAYVNGETYSKLLEMQYKERLKKNKKVSQGSILDEMFKHF